MQDRTTAILAMVTRSWNSAHLPLQLWQPLRTTFFLILLAPMILATSFDERCFVKIHVFQCPSNAHFQDRLGLLFLSLALVQEARVLI